MTIDVCRGRKTITQKQQQKIQPSKRTTLTQKLDQSRFDVICLNQGLSHCCHDNQD